MGLPLAAALVRQGAGAGVLVTYVTSMMLLSFVRVPLELGRYGTWLTALRVANCRAPGAALLRMPNDVSNGSAGISAKPLLIGPD